jgi:hypothetical protein
MTINLEKELRKEGKVKIEQYRPAYFSGYTNEKIEVNSFDELMDISWIKNWGKHKGFYRYSIAVDKKYEEYLHRKPQHTLMAELDGGKKHWVIAIVREKNIDFIIENLPEWHSPDINKTKKDEHI